MTEHWESLPRRVPNDAALFLDFDGTLVELAETPDTIRVPSGLSTLLGAVAERLENRLAIISGRSIEDLERYLGRSSLALSGSHGLELRLAGGPYVAIAAPEWLEDARHQVSEFAAAEGLLVEQKPSSVAIHFRQAPERERDVTEFLDGIATPNGLSVQHGKMVAELRPHGADKGDALRRLMAEPQFASARPLFVGDDLTDEDGFAAAASMGGAGILVGAPRPTAARWRLPDVQAVIAWLEASIGDPDHG
jgi:trehalose 6-phosphate phosphatase